MKNRWILLLITFIASTLPFYAQDNESFIENGMSIERLDTVPSVPSHMYYAKNFTLDRDYNYEHTNRVKALKMQKRGILAIEGFIGLAAMWVVMYPLLDADNNWSLLWAIPAGAVAMGGGYFIMNRWGKSIQKKIDIIESSNMYSYSFNNHIELDAVRFSVHDNTQQYGYGLSLKFNW